MNKTVILFSSEVVLFILGKWALPDIFSKYETAIFFVALGVLLVFLLRENWPSFMTSWHKMAWCNLEDARRIFRDEVTRLRLHEISAEIDIWSDAIGSDHGKALAAQKYILHGLRKGTIIAKGRPEHGLLEESIPTEVAMRDEYLSDFPNDVIVSANGVVYHEPRFLRRSIRRTAMRIAMNDLEFEMVAEPVNQED
tara:strand:- start:361 stop:948 length:588 start_codon:yes stop_codon:yes gene_type:complete